VSELRTVLGQARELLLRDGNDYSGTTFEDVFDASDYWTYFDETLGMGMKSAFDEVVNLFKPGGVLERVGERSGWAAEVAPLAQRVWPALEQEREEVARLRPVLNDPAALHAIDPSLAPAYCPDCRASYCGEHWTDGRCPLGHTKVS
jgi:hypothetical protein